MKHALEILTEPSGSMILGGNNIYIKHAFKIIFREESTSDYRFSFMLGKDINKII